jgi:hypothetical protein
LDSTGNRQLATGNSFYTASMRGRVKAVLFLILLFSSNLAADCTWTPRHSAQFRTTALDLSVDGSFVWLATGYGVQLLEGTDILASIPLPGSTRVVEADGSGFAYAGSGSRVYVVRRDGRNISVVRSVSADAQVNDLLIAGGYLFAATTGGIAHFAVLDRANPVRTSVALNTSTANVTALAATATTLYAADGDATVEMFSVTSPALPQGTGALATMPRASAVHVAEDGFVYVSDRFSRTTEVFSGSTRVATHPYSALSFAGSAGRVHYLAGGDLTLRAVDFSQPGRAVELFEAQFAATDGNDNAIHALERAGNTLYVAAGDAGLATIDVGVIRQPYPLVSYGSGATTSVVGDGNKAWFITAAGAISEQEVNAAGISLGETRTWNAEAGARLRDVRDNGLLTTNGAAATLWSLASATPTPALTATFADTIRNAVLADAYLVALLPNGSVYTLTSGQANPQKVNVPAMTLLARGGSGIALAEVQATEGKTILHYWPSGDLATPARQIAIDGAAVTMALDATRTAVFTFTGINVVDLATGAVRVIPGSDVFIPLQLDFAGDDLLALDARRLFVYANAATLVREQALTANAVALDSSGTVAVLATDEGVSAVSRVTSLPRPLAPFGNNYYTKAVAGSDRVYLFSRNGVDIFSTAGASPLRYVRGIRAPGAVDLAASERGVFTLAGNGTISAFSTVGATLAQRTLAEGADQQVRSIWIAGDAVWVSLTTGCTTGGCVPRTLVLDPVTLAVAATLPGTVRDLVVSGTRAYALFETPNEIRVYNVTAPLQPAQLAATPAPASATSLAHESSRVHVLGDRLYTYDEGTLAAAGQRLPAVTPDESQRIRIQSGCAIITGRSESPELYSVPSWSAAPAFELPSSVRSLVLQDGRAIFLTGHSVEIWTTLPSPPAPRRRHSVR